MHLSDHDLRQLDEAYLRTLSPEQAGALLSKALADLKVARERLGQNPSNSSRPPSTRAPWEQDEGGTENEGKDSEGDSAVASRRGEGEAESEPNGEDAPEKAGKGERSTAKGGRPGRRKGAPGHSRMQHLPVDERRTHAPDRCAICGEALDEFHASRAHYARYEIDLIRPGAEGSGLVLHQTKHTLRARHALQARRQ
jgi:hypothetical protein